MKTKKYADGGMSAPMDDAFSRERPDAAPMPMMPPRARRPVPANRPMPPVARRPVPGKPRGVRGGVWTEDSGVPVPQEPDMGSARMKKGGTVKESMDMKRVGRGETKAKMQSRGFGMARGGKVCKMM
jgi:hypothetical protein